MIAGTRAMKTLVASLVGLFGLVLLGALLLDGSERLVDPDRGRRRVHRHRHGRHPLQPDQRSTSPSTSASTTASTSPTPTPSATDSASEPRIDTSDLFYFGEPFETIQIPGTYVGVDGPERLRLQIRRAAGWTWFPLPVFTQPSGEFRAFVELGAGQYRLRLVDPETGVMSQVLTVLVV